MLGPGKVGPYTLLQPIGLSGAHTGRWMARSQEAGSALVLLQIHSEAVLDAPEDASSSSSPVPELLDEGRTEDHRYRVFPLPLGWTLAQALHDRREAGGELSLEGAAALVANAARAVDRLHRNGLLHLELSPDGIFLLENGEVRLGDPGRAWSKGQALPPGGLPGYAAPEQVRGESPGPFTDVYALGLVLWELLTLEPFFHRLPLPELMRAQAQPRSASPDQVRAGLPTGMSDVCLRAMSADSGRRYATAEALADALEGLTSRAEGQAARKALVDSLERGSAGGLGSLAPFPQALPRAPTGARRTGEGSNLGRGGETADPGPTSPLSFEPRQPKSETGRARWGLALAFTGAAVAGGFGWAGFERERSSAPGPEPSLQAPSLQPAVKPPPETPRPGATVLLQDVLRRGRGLARESSDPKVRRAAAAIAERALVELGSGAARRTTAEALMDKLRSLEAPPP